MSELKIDGSDYRRYNRKGLVEARPWSPGEDMNGISVSDKDVKAGSPKKGDMIGRNPVDHADRWLIAEEYFQVNYEPEPPTDQADWDLDAHFKR